MGMISRPVAFESAPSLEVVAEQLRQHTGLAMTVRVDHHDPKRGIPYTSSAEVVLATGESLELFRTEQEIAVQYLQSLWREKYLVYATLFLLRRLGGHDGPHPLPRWAPRAWADVPKIFLLADAVAYYALGLLLLPVMIATVVVGSLVGRVRRRTPHETPKS